MNKFRSKIFSTYTAAIQSCSVSFTGTKAYIEKENGILYQVRFAPQLLKKPTNPDSTSSPVKTRIDPFENPDKNLYVTPIGSSDSHYIVLNKFPVIPAHFILATTKFENQADKLTRNDWDAVASIFSQWYDETASSPIPPQHHISETAAADVDVHRRTEIFGFFNCGEDSGASQPHRHLQFLTLSSEEAEELFITDYVSKTSTKGEVISHPNAAFEHYIFPFATELSSDVLVTAYGALLSRISTTSYNLAFTKTYMAICPRTKETAYPVAKGSGSGVIMDGVEIPVPGLGLNGTMLAGMLLVKTDVEMRALLDGEKGVIGRMFAEVGVPVKECAEGKDGGVSSAL